MIRALAAIAALAVLLAAPVSAADSGAITYAGSNTIGWLLKQVAPTQVDVSASGSVDGIAALAAGRARLIGLSHEPSEAERATVRAARGSDPQMRELGRGAVAVFVRKDNPLTGITRAQLVEAAAGHLRWSQLGATGALAERPVVVVVNHPHSGSTRLFTDVILGGTLPAAVQVEPVGSSVVQAAAVDEGVLAVASLHQNTPAVRPLPLDGILPDGDTVRDGRYALARPLVLLWMSDPAIDPLLKILDGEDAMRRFYDEGVL